MTLFIAMFFEVLSNGQLSIRHILFVSQDKKDTKKLLLQCKLRGRVVLVERGGGLAYIWSCRI